MGEGEIEGESWGVVKQIQPIGVGELKPGMRVAGAVTDAVGRVLVPASAELSAALIAGLARREVAEVMVEVEVAEDPEVAVTRQAQAVAMVARRFRKAGDGEATCQLRLAVLAHRLGHDA